MATKNQMIKLLEKKAKLESKLQDLESKIHDIDSQIYCGTVPQTCGMCGKQILSTQYTSALVCKTCFKLW
jgi:hypothetical protein